MRRYNITVGAKTTVNGTVRTGYGSWTIDGQAIACEGNEVECSDNPDSVACERVRFVEGGKFLLGTAGGSLGAYAGASSTSSICMALGVTTAVGGIACAAALIGIGSLVGTSIGAEAGEKGGDLLYEIIRP